MNAFIAFLKDEDGQTSTEYILLVVVVAMIVMKFKATATTKLNGLVEQVFNGVSANIDFSE